MSVARRMARIGLLGLALAVATACTTLYRDHGYAPSESDLAEIKVGKDTRDTVAKKIGRPGTMGVLSGSDWYYVQSRYAQYAYKAPKEIDRQVVAISFSDAGVVRNVQHFGLADGRVVVLSRRVTESNTQGIGLLRQLLGSIGRFNAEQLFGQQPGP